jgi:hypothetical protein
MAHPIVHFEIVSPQAPALRHFYHEVFGWTFADATPSDTLPSYALATLDERPPGLQVNCGIGEAPPGYGGHLTVYVGVDDVAATLAAVERAGGTTMMPPDEVPGMGGMTIALFTDPAGNVVGLHHQPTADA